MKNHNIYYIGGMTCLICGFLTLIFAHDPLSLFTGAIILFCMSMVEENNEKIRGKNEKKKT